MPAQDDPKALARRRFQTADHCLSVLEIIDRYASDPPAVIGALLEAARPAGPAGGPVCELGFGSGWLLEEMARAYPGRRLCGLDLSPGMAAHARDAVGGAADVVVGDMEGLPFREAAFEVIVTCWTLYFMRDIDATLEEIKRCLRPGGRLVAAANAPDHMMEFDRLEEASMRAVLGRPPEPGPWARFDLTSGAEHMRRHFPRVELRRWQGWLVLPEVAPLLRIWDAWRPESLRGEDGERVRAELERRARRWLRRDGEMRIRRDGGAFIGYREV